MYLGRGASVKQLAKDLAAIPGLIARLAMGNDNSQLTWRPDTDTWSASDVLAHLRSCADVRGKWIAAMLDRDHPTVRAVSPRSAFRKYVDRDFGLSLKEFALERAALVKRLQGLDAAGWERGLTFTGASPKRTEQTLAQCATDLLEHERVHLEHRHSADLNAPTMKEGASSPSVRRR